MKQQSTTQALSASPIWERLEVFVREQVQRFIQALLAEEITEFLGRAKCARRAAVDAPKGQRNGCGKPRQFTLTAGTVTVRRPRIRGLGERFVSRVLPLFKRRTHEVGELLPQRYLHGLALGDFDLALRGLLGDAAPRSPTSLARLKAQWQLEYEAWKRRRLEDLEMVDLWADG
jgi:putative transposase